jgi:hypothetical protein
MMRSKTVLEFLPVDDIIIKTRQRSSLIIDLEETFANISCFNIKLNLEKCTF